MDFPAASKFDGMRTTHLVFGLLLNNHQVGIGYWTFQNSSNLLYLIPSVFGYGDRFELGTVQKKASTIGNSGI
jgi:hypothetical protein